MEARYTYFPLCSTFSIGNNTHVNFTNHANNYAVIIHTNFDHTNAQLSFLFGAGPKFEDQEITKKMLRQVLVGST